MAEKRYRLGWKFCRPQWGKYELTMTGGLTKLTALVEPLICIRNFAVLFGLIYQSLLGRAVKPMKNGWIYNSISGGNFAKKGLALENTFA